MLPKLGFVLQWGQENRVSTAHPSLGKLFLLSLLRHLLVNCLISEYENTELMHENTYYFIKKGFSNTRTLTKPKSPAQRKCSFTPGL